MKWAWLIVFVGGSAFAAPNPYLAQAKVFQLGLEWEKCLKRLDSALHVPSTDHEQVEIEIYFGLCHLGLSHEKDAADHFEMALKIDRNAELPALVGPKVTALFQKVRAKLPPEEAKPEPKPEPAPVVKSEPKAEPKPEPAPQAAPVEAVTVVSEQQQARPERHWLVPLALAGVALAGAGVGTGAGLEARSYETRANQATFASDIYQLGQSARSDGWVANIAFAVAGAALIAAVITFFAIN